MRYDRRVTRRPILALLPLLLALFALPVNAAPPKKAALAKAAAQKKALQKTARTKQAALAIKTVAVPLWERPNAQALVTQGKLPAFYNPNDLRAAPVLSVPSAILIDADSGQVLWEKEADVRRPIASTTKILTALLFIEHTKPDDIIKCNDANITKIEESSLHIKPGETFTAENLLYGFLLRSGNDAGVVIAENIGGSIAGFADMMNARAKEIGAVNSHFMNPHGLTVPGHYSTARDLALIARVAMQNPRFAEAVRLPVRTIERSINKGDTHIVSRMKKRFHDKFPGADGIKTGNTKAAGFCFVGSATRAGEHLISVVLGARGGSSINDTVALQGWGFHRFSPVILTKKGEVVGRVPVIGGTSGSVPAEAAQDLRAVADNAGGSAEQIRYVFVPTAAQITAPIAEGTIIGKVQAMQGGKVLSEVDAVAMRAISAAPLEAAMGQASRGVALPVLASVGSAALCLILWRTYAGTITKSTGSRRGRVPPQR